MPAHSLAANGYRLCRTCGERKPETPEFFHRRSEGAGRQRAGFYPKCKACRVARVRAFREEYPERRNGKHAEYVKKHAAWWSAYMKKWRAEHREQVREHSRRDQERHRAERLERQKLQRRLDPIPHRLNAHQQRIKRARAAGLARARDVRARIAYYGWRCWMCGAPWEVIDHVIPIALGGSNWPANLRPACFRCNAKKGARRVT